MSAFEADKTHAPDGSSRSVYRYLEAVASDRYPDDRQRILVGTVQLLIPGIIEEAKRLGEPKAAYGLVADALRIVSHMDIYLHPEERSAQNRYRLWHHLSQHRIVDPATSDISSIDRREFEACVGEYLARPWMQHDYLDWCIVDALTAQEWSAYLQVVRGQRSAKRFLGAFGAAGTILFIVLSVWGLRHLFSTGSVLAIPAAIAFAAVIAWELVGFIRRRVARLRAKVPTERSLLLAMRDAYATLDGMVLSPTRVRDALRAADAKGVGWSQAVWPVIDAAVARNPNLWQVAPPPISTR